MRRYRKLSAIEILQYVFCQKIPCALPLALLQPLMTIPHAISGLIGQVHRGSFNFFRGPKLPQRNRRAVAGPAVEVQSSFSVCFELWSRRSFKAETDRLGKPHPLFQAVLFATMAKHRECLRVVLSRRATEAYPQWYVAGSGTPRRRP